ncbi:MAG: hypothetical protein QOF94_1116, partial [Acidobacteriaceae bacterium]
MNKPAILALRTATMAAATFIVLLAVSLAQETTPAAVPQIEDSALRDLDSQVRELRAVIEQMRAENAQSRGEMHELRQELQDTRKLLLPLVASVHATPSQATPGDSAQSTGHSISGESGPQDTSAAQAAGESESRIQKLEESTQLLGAKINEQYQTKVET